MKKKAGLLTEVDWKRFREEFGPIIKKEAKRALEEIKPKWAKEMEEIVENKIENTKPIWADRMMTVLDTAAGDYKKFDEEKTVLAGQISNHGDAIDDIDGRVTAIEEKFGFPSAV